MKATSKSKRLPKVVPSSRFHEYVPGETPLHVDRRYWNGLSLNVFEFPRINEGVEAPGIPGCGLAFYDRGGVKNAYYGYDGSSWKPHHIQQNTFQLVGSRCGPKWQWELDENVGPFTATNLILEPELLQRTAYETLGASRVDIRFDNLVGAEDDVIGALAMALKNEAECRTPFGKMYGETAAQLLAVHLLKYYSSIDGQLPTGGAGLRPAQLRRVREYFDAYMEQDISLETLARLCGLSVYHFARLFKLSTGMPPHQYLIQHRMKVAERLIRHSRLSFLQIALRVGYRDQSHFSTLFKSHYGLSPSEYRRQLSI